MLIAGMTIPFGKVRAKSRPRVAVLAASTKAQAQHLMNSFTIGLKELGWREGGNIELEYYYANGNLARLKELAKEIVKSGPDLIFAPPEQAAVEVQQLTRDIPIVFAIASDPVGGGLVTSLARPAGNATGLSNINIDISAKRLQLLKELSPRIKRVAILFNKQVSNALRQVELTEKAGEILKVEVVRLDVSNKAGLEKSFAEIQEKKVEGIIVNAEPLLFTERKWIAERARAMRVVSLASFSEFASAGGLSAYATDFPMQFRRAAHYVDKILKGARAGELPVEEPVRLQLTININTARTIGLEIPQAIQLRADRIIE